MAAVLVQDKFGRLCFHHSRTKNGDSVHAQALAPVWLHTVIEGSSLQWLRACDDKAFAGMHF